MELCLYEPELGYYSRAREQFGKAGDFYTSSDVHAVFGRLLARQFEEMWRAMDSPARVDLVELGPGRGLFARDVLDWSAKQFPDFSRALKYLLVEQSEHLREKLRERLSEHIAGGKCEVLESPTLSPTEGEEGGAPGVGDNIIVFGNEFFDALPVEVIDHRGSVRVGYENGRFVETFVAPSAAENEFLGSLRRPSGRRRAGGGSAAVAELDGAHRKRFPRPARISCSRRLRLHAGRAARGASSRHHHVLSPAHGEQLAVRGSRRAGHHGARQFHCITRARRTVWPGCVGVSYAIAIPDRDRRRDGICGCVPGLQCSHRSEPRLRCSSNT